MELVQFVDRIPQSRLLGLIDDAERQLLGSRGEDGIRESRLQRGLAVHPAMQKCLSLQIGCVMGAADGLHLHGGHSQRRITKRRLHGQLITHFAQRIGV